mgnify:CR=1 FL=1
MTGTLAGRLPADGLGVDLDLHLLADQHAARLEGLVPREAEVLAVDLGAGDEADARLGSGSGVPLKRSVANNSQPRASALLTHCHPRRKYEFPRSQCGSTQRRFCCATTCVPCATR